ncbi:MAG: PASTA domain-containing protein [Calditrichaeota bacterium]|nr:PASTA domain-containing protein [Calditrichota bacterium]
MDNRHEAGTVVDQFPVAGSLVKPGRRVEVVLSVREQLLICPDVMGRSPREAVLIADSTGIVVLLENVTYRHSNALPEGVIMYQQPQPNERILRNSELSLTVSTGTKPEKIVAPDLIGRQISEIDLVLAKFELKLGQVSRYPQKSSREGIILEQTPKSGTAMVSGQRIDLKIAVSPSKKGG